MDLSSARPIPCTYPGCAATFRTPRGATIHRTLRGHQRTTDSVERGDGDPDRPGPTHPAYRNPPDGG